MALAKVRDILKMLRRDGWYLDRQSGSHRQFRHTVKPGTVTVAGKENVTLPHPTVNSILEQAGLTKEDFKR
jgi:predicted RNA binding protein YcfA (HicA-like mRNA interferase family)